MVYEEKVLLLREIARYARIKSIRVRGFKSLRDVEITFPTNLTIVIGPNGSGKTALIESMLLLREILNYIRGRNPSPFTKWWGFRNVVWKKDVRKNIEISLMLDLSKLLEPLCALEKKFYEDESFEIPLFMVDSLKNILARTSTIRYCIEVSEEGEIVYLREKLVPEATGFEIVLTRNNVEIRRNGNILLRINTPYTSYMLLDKYDEVIRLLNIGATIGNSFNNILDDYGSALKNHVEESDFLADSLAWAALISGTLIDGITCIKEVDLNSIRGPQALVWHDYLEYNASNLIPVLYRLGKGRLPDNVKRALQVLFDNRSVDGFFSLTPEGTVFFKLVVGDLEIPPPSIPSGVWKVMAIETALLLNPTILLIDEFENSLHARIQEYLLDEIRESGATAIVTTHSPVPVDYARDLNEILVLESTGYETRASRLENVDEYKEKLRKLGLTPSEALLYGFIGD